MVGTIGCGTIGSGTIGNACPTTATITEPTGAGGKYDPSPRTRAYWDRERTRLATIRDDEELLVIL